MAAKGDTGGGMPHVCDILEPLGDFLQQDIVTADTDHVCTIKTLNRMDEYEAGRGHSLRLFKRRDVLEGEWRDPAARQTNVHELGDLQLFSLMISGCTTI